VTESTKYQDFSKTTADPRTPGRPGKKVSRLAPPPSAETLRVLRWLVARSKRSTGVQLAKSFLRRNETSDPTPPPLALLLRGGQGGEVRLKLYLTMSLLAVSAPYDIKPIPARSWAEALGLDDPERNGARRVNDAIDWLAKHKFLVSDRRRGTPGSVRLLSQAGTGDPYTRPTVTGRYVKVPLGLWDQGWIARLSGTALALYIVLIDAQAGRAAPQWSSPAQARQRYDLSPDTWTKGARELKAFHLVSVSKRRQGDTFDYRRMRNVYLVRDELHRAEYTSPPQQPTRRRSDSVDRILNAETEEQMWEADSRG
jgi:hypothetical protein